MKSILSLLFLLISFYDYGQTYTIRGTLPDHSSDGQYILLSKARLGWSEELVVIDSVLVNNGEFLFKGKTKNTPYLVYLNFSRGARIPYFFILEPGEIKITVRSEKEMNCSGTPLNDEYNHAIIIPSQLVKRADSLGDRKQKVISAGGEWTEDEELEYRAEFPLEQAKIRREKKWEFIEKHVQYPEVVVYELYSYYDDKFEKDPRVDAILVQLPKSVLKRMKQANEYYEKAMNEYIKKNGMPKIEYVENTPEAVKVGKPFSDFSGETPDGKQIRLSEVVKNNKLVLIDFWASWCGPCMEEMPNIAELYRQYKDKGLEIIGISSDQSAQRWTETIQKRNMTWPQIRSAGEDRIGSTYGIKFIPYTILIDHDGTIIARKLNGKELQQKIKEILQ